MLHSVAILKGVVEGDPLRHLAALGGFEAHLRPLLSAGLVERADDENDWVKVTGLGREFYASQGLAELPEGRANAWPGPAVDSAVAALSALVVDQP